MKTKVEWFVCKIDGAFPGILYAGPLSNQRATASIRSWRKRHAGTDSTFRLVKTTHEEVEG